MTLWTKVRLLVARAYAWERVDANRRAAYKRGRAVIAGLGTLGLITPGEAGKALVVLGILSGISLVHMAGKNV